MYFADCEGSSRNDVSQYYDDQSAYESAATITLSEGQAQTGIDVSLAQGTTISGNVYDGAGASTPLEGICVYADPTSGEAGDAPDVQTGAGGAYTLTHITPGVGYDVEFYDCGSARKYLTQYYDGASEYTSAKTITPTLKSPSTNIDAHLEKGASISGTVTDSKGHPITTEDICVNAYAAGTGDPYDDYSEARTNASGQYTIGALAPGSYKVHFFDCYNSARNDVSAVLLPREQRRVRRSDHARSHAGTKGNQRLVGTGNHDQRPCLRGLGYFHSARGRMRRTPIRRPATTTTTTKAPTRRPTPKASIR